MLTPPMLRTLSSANEAARRLLYRSETVARAVFNAKLRACDEISFWELGTLAMRQALVRDLRNDLRVAEVGTGPYATLALWAASRWRLDIVATELEPHWADWAQRSAEGNGITLDVRCTDLLEGVEGDFDLIWFVPPFTSAAVFKKQMAWAHADDDALRRHASRTLGGEHGWEVLDRYLGVVSARLRPGGHASFCINRVHQRPEMIRGVIGRRGLRLVREIHWRFPPYSVLSVSS